MKSGAEQMPQRGFAAMETVAVLKGGHTRRWACHESTRAHNQSQRERRSGHRPPGQITANKRILAREPPYSSLQ